MWKVPVAGRGHSVDSFYRRLWAGQQQTTRCLPALPCLTLRGALKKWRRCFRHQEAQREFFGE